jgi:subtilase family serine protease
MRRIVLLAGVSLAVGLAAVAAAAGGGASTRSAALPLPRPTVSDWIQLTNSEMPPTQAQCNSAGRRCFTPQSTRAAYDLNAVYAPGFAGFPAGVDGTGVTIAIVDSYGSDTIAHDLHVYDTQMHLPPMCGEESVTCTPGMPTFSRLAVQGSPATKAPPPTSQGNGLEDKAAWALEVSLDVETAHSIAPGANILLVTTPTAETLGLQGFPPMMNAEDYVVKNHLAQVISQSFGSAELAFGSSDSLMSLRGAYMDAAQNGVTVLASSGDDGSAGLLKQSLLVHSKKDSLIPVPTVGWPASDPLVTGVGGTYLCVNAMTGVGVDNTSPPANCQNQSKREIGWIDGGGGFSNFFSRPDYQNTLPTGSTAIPSSQRGVPDVAFQASSRTGALVYLTLPPDGLSGLICPGGSPCSTGWYDIGGTSLSCPQWAGIVALADQVNGGGLGLINPALYKIGSDKARYANDFYDVTTGNNGAFAPTVPGYSAGTGWDPVTGLGTPDAAKLVPDLVAAVHGH